MAAKKKSASKRKTEPTKAEEVVTSEGVQLLLGNMIGEKDRTYYFETYLKLLSKQQSAASAVSDFTKKAKEAGVDMAAVKLTLKLEKMDALDLATTLKQAAAFIKDRGLPVQLSLYEPKYGTVEDQAGAMGWAAALAGKSPEIELWPESSPGLVEYMRRWNDGQKELVMKMGTSEE